MTAKDNTIIIPLFPSIKGDQLPILAKSPLGEEQELQGEVGGQGQKVPAVAEPDMGRMKRATRKPTMLAPQKSTDGKNGAESEESEGSKTLKDSADCKSSDGAEGGENSQDSKDIQKSGVVIPHGGYF